MIAPSPRARFFLAAGLTLLALVISIAPAHAEEVSVIGQVESLFLGRVSVRVLRVVSPASPTASIKIGDRVSFALPKGTPQRGRRAVKYGSVIEMDLLGSVATEYDPPKQATDTRKERVMIWTARRVERVRNPRAYLEPAAGKDGKEKGEREQGEPPPKIWTQDEVVIGRVTLRDDRLYLREDRLRPRDRGLLVLSDTWVERLRAFEGQRVVTYGTTNRASAASGTMEIRTIMRVYPK